MSCFKNALIFGDQNFSSGDHFTKESRQKATSEKLELEALYRHLGSASFVSVLKEFGGKRLNPKFPLLFERFGYD